MNNPDDTRQDNKPRWLLYSVILLNQILTALAFPIAKQGLNELEPLSLAFFRFVLCSAIYIPILYFLRKKRAIPRRDHARIFIIGLFLIPLNQVVFLIGQSMTLAGHASILFATIPIFVYVMAVIFLKEKVVWRRSAGILIAVSGVYIILSGGRIEFGSKFLYGDLLIMVAVISWAAATVMMRPLAIRYGAIRVTGLALGHGVLRIPTAGGGASGAKGNEQKLAATVRS